MHPRRTLEEVYNMLLADLAIRETNNSVGSGMGGNPTQLFFLITKGIELKHINGDVADMHFSDNKFVVRIPQNLLISEKVDLLPLRNRLNLFVNTVILHDSEKVSFEQLTNLSFLTDQPIKNRNILLLIKAMGLTNSLQVRLNDKMPTYHAAGKLFSTEEKAIEISFLEEMGLPPTSLDQPDRGATEQQRAELDQLCNLLKSHPVWGAKLEATGTRHQNVINLLISDDDKATLKLVSGFPDWIRLCALRRSIGIEQLLNFNLDDYLTKVCIE